MVDVTSVVSSHRSRCRCRRRGEGRLRQDEASVSNEQGRQARGFRFCSLTVRGNGSKRDNDVRVESLAAASTGGVTSRGQEPGDQVVHDAGNA